MKIHFFTLGCKTNQYETNAMEQNFIKNGYNTTDEIADIYVVNTCSVTNIAERKSRQMLRRAKELNPKAVVVACGCYAQVAKKEIEKIPEIDLILGINEKNNIVEIVEEYLKEKNKLAEVSDVMHQKDYQDFGTTTYTELNRAVIKIQDGCDRFCSYCIIPYARGMVRSRKPENIIKEIEEISKEGIKEVVLTGIHIASYGKDFSDQEVSEYRKKYGYKNEYVKFNPKDDLATGGFRVIELLEQINKISTIQRIRIGSIEPKLITKEFVERLSKLEKICHHFHLSLQSGNDETLKRMNRRYTIDEFTNSVQLLRNTYNDVALTTDIIVGFPGETTEEFEKTYEFLKFIKFYKMHIFKYSPKKGTVAEKMPEQIDGKVKEERSQRLINLSDKNEKEHNEKYMNKIVDVLIEESDGKYLKGHTGNYLLVKIPDTFESEQKEKIINEMVKVKIEKLEDIELIGTLVDKK